MSYFTIWFKKPLLHHLTLILIAVIGLTLFSPSRAMALSRHDSRIFNHFVQLDRQVGQLYQQETHLNRCSPQLLNALEGINGYLQMHPFIADELLRQGQGSIPLSLTIQQATCFNINKNPIGALRVLERGKRWSNPFYLSKNPDETYHQFVIEQAEALTKSNQHKRAFDLLNQYVHSPIAPYGNKNTQAAISDLWGEALLSQGMVDESRRMYIRYLGSLRQYSPHKYDEIERIEKMVQALRTPNPNNPNTKHYVDFSDNLLFHWHKETHTVRVQFTPTPYSLIQQQPPAVAALLHWTPQRIQQMKHALQQWADALKSVHPLEFVTVQPGQPYDVSFELHLSLEKNKHSESVGYNHSEYLGKEIIRNDIWLAVISTDNKPRGEAELYATALHEIGHMMGLDHSPYIRDVMSGMRFSDYGFSPPSKLTERDITSIQTLYQHPAKTTNIPNKALSKTK